MAMEISRRGFVGGALAFGTLGGLRCRATASASPENPW